jgi:hypothetical protein
MNTSILHKIWRIFLLGLLPLLIIACAANQPITPEPTSPPATPEPTLTAVAITPTATPVPTALPTATATAAPTTTPEAQLPELPRLDNGRVDDPTFPEALQGRVTRMEYVADDGDGRWLAYGVDENAQEFVLAEKRVPADGEAEWELVVGEITEWDGKIGSPGWIDGITGYDRENTGKHFEIFQLPDNTLTYRIILNENHPDYKFVHAPPGVLQIRSNTPLTEGLNIQHPERIDNTITYVRQAIAYHGTIAITQVGENQEIVNFFGNTPPGFAIEFRDGDFVVVDISTGEVDPTKNAEDYSPVKTVTFVTGTRSPESGPRMFSPSGEQLRLYLDNDGNLLVHLKWKDNALLSMQHDITPNLLLSVLGYATIGVEKQRDLMRTYGQFLGSEAQDDPFFNEFAVRLLNRQRGTLWSEVDGRREALDSAIRGMLVIDREP